MVRIFVIDRYAVSRYGLMSILEKHPELQVIGDATNASEALTRLGDLQPDVIIMDTCTPGGDGAEAITLLRQKLPHVKVLICTNSEKEEDLFKAIRAGARGYLLKSIEPAELVESIRLTASGNATVSPLTAFRSLQGLGGGANRENRSGFDSLSPREKEVLCLVAQGASNKEIAAHCYVSETTAKAHLRRILDKLKVKNRVQAAALAISKGMLNQS